MSAHVGNKNAHSSPSDIIETFNHFFINVPTNKSFDMTYKVYIRDLADSVDRTVSARSSLVSVHGGTQPINIASHGIIPTMTTSSTALSVIPSTRPSSTNLTLKSLTSDSVTTSQIERLCDENMNRKARSMVDLSDFNEQYGNGFQPPAPAVATPLTVYENLGSISKKKTMPAVSPSPSTFTKNNYGRLVESDAQLSASAIGPPIRIRVADCFD